MSMYVSDILSLVFGNISIVINIIIGFSQLISIAKTKNTSGTSLSSYIIFVINGFSWLIWAIMSYVANASYMSEEAKPFLALHLTALGPLIISNLVIACLSVCILFYKVKYLTAAKKLKMTELEYSQLVFDSHKKDTWIKRYRSLFYIGGGLLLICVGTSIGLYFIGVPEQISEQQYNSLSLAVFAINIAAALFNEAISWPQFIKCMKTKDTSGISLGWAISLLSSCVVCLGYDVCLAISFDYRDVLASLICNGVIINALVLIVKLKNHFAARKLGISEWVYTKKYIATKHKNK